MKSIIFIYSFFILLNFNLFSGSPGRIFSKEDIKNLAGAYLEDKLDFSSPVLIDVDMDGDFDALKFDDGNVEYYKNTGTLLNPSFVLENKNYDSYAHAVLIEPKIPYPVFFADMDGDNDMDLFVIMDKNFNESLQRTEYKVGAAENVLGLDQGTLITIILVLIIVLLVLAIL